MIAVPITQAAAPRFGRYRAADDRAGFRRLLLKVSLTLGGLGVLGVVGAALAGHWLMAVLFGQAFVAKGDLLLVLAAAGALGFQSTLLQTAAVAHRNLRPQVAVVAVALVVTCVVALALVPRLGLGGAVWAVMASAVIEFCGSAALVKVVSGPE